MKMVFRQLLPTSQKEENQRLKKYLLTCICYSRLKHILLNNSTCFIFPSSQVFFLRHLILQFSEHLVQLKPICHNNLLSLHENIRELKFLLKKLVFWNWQDNTSTKVHKYKCLQGADGNWMSELGPGEELWLSGKHMFIYGWQPPLIFSPWLPCWNWIQSCQIFGLKENKNVLFVKFLTFRCQPFKKKYASVSQTKHICGNYLFCELPFATSKPSHLLRLQSAVTGEYHHLPLSVVWGERAPLQKQSCT